MSAMSKPVITPLPEINSALHESGAYLWSIDKAMSDRISNMLGIDFASFGYDGTWVMHEPMNCSCCGKLAGLDDFVAGAIKLGIHNKDFMIKSLIDNAPNNSPAHAIHCCLCGTVYRESDIITVKQAGIFNSAAQFVSGTLASVLGQEKSIAMVFWHRNFDWKNSAKDAKAPIAKVYWMEKVDWARRVGDVVREAPAVAAH